MKNFKKLEVDINCNDSHAKVHRQQEVVRRRTSVAGGGDKRIFLGRRNRFRRQTQEHVALQTGGINWGSENPERSD